MAKHLNFIFRISPKEKRALELMAEREGRSQAGMVRECIREAAKSRGLEAVGLVNLIGHTLLEKEAQSEQQP